MLKLKETYYRHTPEGTRLAEITLHVDSLSNLPTDAADVPGLLADDVIDEGSVALDVTSGDIAMFDSEKWNLW